MRISDSKFRVTEEVKHAAKLRAEAEARRVIQEAEMVHRARAEAKAKAKAEIGMLAAAARAAAKAKAELSAAEEARIDAIGKDEWFYLQDHEQFGPVTLEDLRAKVSDPDLQPPVHLVWAEGMEIWRPVYEVRRVCDPEGSYDITALTGGLPMEEPMEWSEPAVSGTLPAMPGATMDAIVPEVRTDLGLSDPHRRLEAGHSPIDQGNHERVEQEARLRVAAEAKACEEAKLRAGAEARAAEQERLRRIAEQKSAEETRVLTEALAKAREESARREIAEAQAREEARLREVAEATMRVEARRRAAAEAKAAEEERIAAAAEARADEEVKAKLVIEEQAARDAQAVAMAAARIQEETRLRQVAEARAVEEAKSAAAAKQQAERDAREKARIEAKAAEDSRLAALAMARAEEEAKLRREAEARAAEEARQAAMAKARVENEMKAKAELAVKAAEEARKAECATARADEEARLRCEAETRAADEARLAAIAKARQELPAPTPALPEPSQAESEITSLEVDSVRVETAAPATADFVSTGSSIANAGDPADEEAILNAEIDALAEQETRLEELAKDRADKEARARAEFKSRASQAARAVIATKRKVRRQILARSMESERIRALEEAASALMDEVHGVNEEDPVSSTITNPVELVCPPAAITEEITPPEPVTAIVPEQAPDTQSVSEPVEPPPAKPAAKRRQTLLSGKRVWFYTCEGERVGPVAFEDLKEMAEQGTLNPRLDLVWKKGNAEWLPAGRIDGLFPRPADTQRLAELSAPAKTSPLKPRAKSPLPGKNHLWPGARRRSLFVVALVLPFAWEFLLASSQPVLAKRLGVDLTERLVSFAAWVPLLLVLQFGLKRLVNLGMSRWWYLAVFAPVVNLWLGYRCFACPQGYAVHRRMDFTGVLMGLAYWLLIAAVIMNLTGVSAPWMTWLNPAGVPHRIGEAIQQVQAFARR